MTFHPYKEEPKFKYTHINFRGFVQLTLDKNGIYAIIGDQMLNTPHDILILLAYLDHWRNLVLSLSIRIGGGGLFIVLHKKLSDKYSCGISMKYYSKEWRKRSSIMFWEEMKLSSWRNMYCDKVLVYGQSLSKWFSHPIPVRDKITKLCFSIF